jgi:tRNA modification GTPase
MLGEEDRSLASLAARRPHLWLLSKADLPRRTSAEALMETTGGEPVLHVSAKDGQGLEELRQAMRAALLGGPAQAAGARQPDAGARQPDAGAEFLLNARQRQALARSASALAEAHAGLTEGRGEEFVAADLWEALDALGEVTGRRTSDDLLDAIFSRFCIGK